MKMKNLIQQALNNPAELEKLFQNNKREFKQAFDELLPSIEKNNLVIAWSERLHYTPSDTNWGNKKDWIFLFFVSILVGFLAEFPVIFHLNEEQFYQKNIGFLVFGGLIIYFLQSLKLKNEQLFFIGFSTLVNLVFVNFFNQQISSDTFILTCLHIPVFMLFIFGYTYIEGDFRNKKKQVNFLKFLADLLIITGLMVISLGALTGIAVALFRSIELEIADFYVQYILAWMLTPLPVLGAFVLQANPKLVSTLSPLIARIFSPLVLITLLIFLSAFIFGRTFTLDNRPFLMVFNILLIGVMALIFFSISTQMNTTKKSFNQIILWLLSLVTILANLLALYGIAHRITDLGLTANRAAVMGTNVLILIHLGLTAQKLSLLIFRNGEYDEVEFQLVRYLPVYLVWLAIVIFAFPFIF